MIFRILGYISVKIVTKNILHTRLCLLLSLTLNETHFCYKNRIVFIMSRHSNIHLYKENAMGADCPNNSGLYFLQKMPMSVQNSIIKMFNINDLLMATPSAAMPVSCRRKRYLQHIWR